MARVPQKHVKSTSKLLKSLWRGSSSDLSLKSWVFSQVAVNPDIKALAMVWIHNKKANVSNPPLGIGNTKKKKGR